MTSQGSAHARFRRALATRNPLLVTATAAELPQIALEDSLAVCLVYRDTDPERFERAIVRWHALLGQHARAMGAHESQLALAALQALRGPAAAPVARLLAELCALYELSASAEVLEDWLKRIAAGGGLYL
jgi:hypothetical protein